MVQGLFPGATSYETQGLNEILSDAKNWKDYTIEIINKIESNIKKAQNTDYWKYKVDIDFKMEISSSQTFMKAIDSDLSMIIDAIKRNCVTEREVKLLKKIGNNSSEYNQRYRDIYHRKDWQEYDNPDFKPVEELYEDGGDYFASLMDAANAASRLEDYINRGHYMGIQVNVSGDNNNTMIQDHVINSAQNISMDESTNYDELLEVLLKVQEYADDNKFSEEAGESAEKIREAIKETIINCNQKNENGVKKALKTIKNSLSGIATGIIANGIFTLLQNFFPCN